MNCQLQFIDEIAEKNSWFNDKLQYSIRKFRYFKRRIILGLQSAKPTNKSSQLIQDEIKPGDIVSVRSKAEIKGTLDRWRKTRGCTFQNGMYAHCGKEYRVLKKVDHFFDESKQKFCKCNNIYLLEGSYCNGSTAYLKPCDRNCFYFWQTSWLEKV
jgi:hypothetical protein